MMQTLEGKTVFGSDTEIFDFVKAKLYVAAVCDILDELGLRQQAMHHRLRPLLPDPQHCGFVGRARTARWMETDYVVDGDPYGLEIELMDSLKPGDVVTAVGERPVANTTQLLNAVAALKPGSEAAIGVQRGAQALQLKLTVGQRPPAQRRAPQ